MTPRPAETSEIAEILDLIRAEFAFMEGRISPPSSLHDLTGQTVAEFAQSGEIWVLGRPLLAVVFMTRSKDALYLGKLAVASSARGTGLARCLIEHAVKRAKDLGLTCLRLNVRIELTENQRAFAALGFSETARESHPGFDRPTSIVMERRLN